MIVGLKIYPIAGLTDSSREMTITLMEGRIEELLSQISERLETDKTGGSGGRPATDKPIPTDGLMLLVNGKKVDLHEDILLCDGDQLRLMPIISGG